MEKLTYVTNNFKRYVHTKERFDENGITIDYLDCRFKKTNSKNISLASMEEAELAYKLIGNPVIVTKTGFYIESYPKNRDYPGIDIEKINNDVDKLIEDMKGINNRNCQFINCLTYYDGEEFKQFYCPNFGSLSEEVRNKSANNSLYNVFIPVTSTKTLSEISKEEISKLHDGRVNVQEQFIKWYSKNKTEGIKQYTKLKQGD